MFEKFINVRGASEPDICLSACPTQIWRWHGLALSKNWYQLCRRRFSHDFVDFLDTMFSHDILLQKLHTMWRLKHTVSLNHTVSLKLEIISLALLTTDNESQII